MALLREPELFALLAAILGTLAFIFDARRRRAPLALIVAGTVDFLAGLLSFSLAVLHLGGVLSRALRGKGFGGAEAFAYDFRFYSLVLVGVLIAVSAFLCLMRARGLTRGEASAWKVALWASVALLAVNAPLMPIQGFAIGLAGFALVNLGALAATRKRFRAASQGRAER